MRGAFSFGVAAVLDASSCCRVRRRAGLLSRWHGIGAYEAVSSYHALGACVSYPPDARQSRFECCTVKTALLAAAWSSPNRDPFPKGSLRRGLHTWRARVPSLRLPVGTRHRESQRDPLGIRISHPPPMENIILISTILAIHVFAWLTPGPLFVLIIRNALVYSRKIGIWTAVGIAIGNFVHIAYSIAAATLLISISDAALTVLKFLGVGYLAYLGFKIVFTRPSAGESETTIERENISSLEAFKTGFLANILNPNASLFFASIFATLISSGAAFWAVGFLWIAMPINSFVMASVLSVFFTQSKIRATFAKYKHVANIFLGVALLLLALMIAFYD